MTARAGGIAATGVAPDGGAGPAACTSPRRPVVALVAASLDTPGGQGIQAQWLAENLSADGFPVTRVFVDPAFPRGLRWLRRYPYLRTLLNQVLYLRQLRALTGADVVHIFSASYVSFLLGPAPALVVARLLGKRVILNYHSGEAADHLARWGLGVHPWLRLAHHLVVPSAYLDEVFAQYGYKVTVVPNLIDLSGFQYRERPAIAPRFLSIRNLEPHYGVDVVLKAYARIRRDHPRATLVVAGYGSEEKNLKRMAEDLGLSGVRFHGRFSRAQAAQLYAEADVLLNASTVDNQPVSILEAFASGVLVVSTPTGDIPAMLQGGASGVIVAPDDPEAMAMAAINLMKRPQQALRMARRARASLDRYDWQQVRVRWADVYGVREP